jgi:hypothetical protein
VRVLSAILMAFLVSSCAVDPVSAVTVLDERFNVVKVLSPIELVEFNKHWQGKEEVQADLEQNEGRHLKLDVEAGETGTRWLYYSNGLVSLLSPFSQPIYKILAAEDFNHLLGEIPKTGSGVIESGDAVELGQ